MDFHGRLDSDSTHLSQSRVKFDSRLMSRAQPCNQLSMRVIIVLNKGIGSTFKEQFSTLRALLF